MHLKFWQSAILVFVGVSLTGCTSTINLIRNQPSPNELRGVNYRITYEPSDQRETQVVVKLYDLPPRTDSSFLGYALNGLIFGNVARVAAEYPSEAAANGATILAFGASCLLDWLINSYVSSLPPFSVTPQVVEISRDSSSINSQSFPLQAVGNYTYQATIPPIEEGGTGPVYAWVRNFRRDVLVQDYWQLLASVPTRPSVPPKLTTEVNFQEPVGDRALHAEEGAELQIKIINSGPGLAHDVTAKFKLSEDIPGLKLPSAKSFGDIPPKSSRYLRIPLVASKALRDGQATIEIGVEDRNQFDAPPIKLTVKTRAYQPVLLGLANAGIQVNNEEGIPRRGEQVDLLLQVKNKGQIPARNVNAHLIRDNQDLVLGGPEYQELKDIPVGGWKIASFSIFVKNSYNGPQELPIKLRLTEEHGNGETIEPIKVVLEQAAPRLAEILVDPVAVQAGTNDDPILASDVDKPLANKATQDPDAVAVVIGLERYNKRIPKVTYAERDAKTVSRYFRDALGVPRENIIEVFNEDATRTRLELMLQKKLPAMVSRGKSQVYVYYAGHGAPSATDKTPYLIPYDGDPSYLKETSLSTTAVYEALAKIGARNVTVIMDACFSGQDGRGNQVVTLVPGSRPAFLESITPNVPRGITVLAAAGPNQLSSAYPGMRHGLFTYFFLKALRKETVSDLSVGNLEAYLKREVSRQAIRMDREQTPVVIDGNGDPRRIIGPGR